MFIDKELLLSDDQAITATTRSTNVIDMGAIADKAAVGKGDADIEVFAQVTEAFDSAANDGTLTVALCTDSDETISSGGVVLAQTAAIAEASLVAGYQFSLGKVPVNALEFLDLNYTVAGSGNFTAGKITAGLILDRQTNKN